MVIIHQVPDIDKIMADFDLPWSERLLIAECRFDLALYILLVSILLVSTGSD